MASIPSFGDYRYKGPVSSLSDLPLVGQQSETRLVEDSEILYAWSDVTQTWNPIKAAPTNVIEALTNLPGITDLGTTSFRFQNLEVDLITAITSNEINLGDQFILLNSEFTGSPTQDAGLEVNRGSEQMARLIWDEDTDRWQAGVNGTLQNILLEGDLPETGMVSVATIENFTATLAGTEYSYSLPVGSKRFTIKARANEKVQLAFASGQSGTEFLTVNGYYKEDNLDPDATFTLYFQASKPGTIVEIISWA